MSALHLQRIVVRMLYDPTFVETIFADPAAALQREEITEQERRWLVATDQRAYTVDPLRRTRTLTALIEEFPVSVHQVVQRTSSPARLDAFFSSAYFHACIQQRGSLAAAFSAYLLSADSQPQPSDPIFTHLVHLETALAQLRRRQSRGAAPVPQDSLELAPTAVLMRTPVGALAYYHATLDLLRNDPDGLVAAALKTALVPMLQESTEQEWLLIVWNTHIESATLELLPGALGCLLATTPAAHQALVATACTLGADVDEAAEIINDLLADGILCYAGTDTRSTHD